MDTMKARREESSTLNTELVSSWAILFATSPHHKDKISAYDQLGKPKWHRRDRVYDYYNTHPDAYADVRFEHLQQGGSLFDSGYRESLKAAFNKPRMTFAEFPVLESRLRQLRHYMDIQKPRGIRQLWRDNRDSSNYYTFWIAISFGLLTIILAMGSLAVSIAQTWALFRALPSECSQSRKDYARLAHGMQRCSTVIIVAVYEIGSRENGRIAVLRRYVLSLNLAYGFFELAQHPFNSFPEQYLIGSHKMNVMEFSPGSAHLEAILCIISWHQVRSRVTRAVYFLASKRVKTVSTHSPVLDLSPCGS